MVGWPSPLLQHHIELPKLSEIRSLLPFFLIMCCNFLFQLKVQRTCSPRSYLLSPRPENPVWHFHSLHCSSNIRENMLCVIMPRILLLVVTRIVWRLRWVYHWWTDIDKSEPHYSEKKPFSALTCTPKISHGMVSDWNRSFVMTERRVTTGNGILQERQLVLITNINHFIV
jgi:hypothetical protein